MQSQSLFDQEIVMPHSEPKFTLMREDTMPFPHSFFPSTRILNLPDLKYPVSVSFSTMILSSEEIAIGPFELPISFVQPPNEPPFIPTTALQNQLPFPTKLTTNKLPRIVGPVFKSKGALTMVQSVDKLSIVGHLISREPSLHPFTFVVGAIETKSLAPLLSFALQHTSVKLTVQALSFSDDCAETVREVLMVETEIIKTIRVVLTVACTFSIFNIPLEKGLIRHRSELEVGNCFTVVSAKFQDICPDVRPLQFAQKIITIYRVVLKLFRTRLALTHSYNQLYNIFGLITNPVLIVSKLRSFVNKTSLYRPAMIVAGCRLAVRLVLCILKMWLTNEQERTRRAIFKNEVRSPVDPESYHNRQARCRKQVELRQAQAVPNLLYVFPRVTIPEDSSESSWEQQQEAWTLYDLMSQNRKNYQMQTNSIMHARYASTGEAARVQSAGREQALSQPKKKEESPTKQSRRHKENKESGRMREEKLSSRKKDEINLSNYNSRKPGQKTTTLNSSKRLLVAEQYSLASQQAKTKKVSQAVTLTCRRRQPPRNRVATEHS